MARTGKASANSVNGPETYVSTTHALRLRYRQGQQAARRRRLGQGLRRHPRQGRQADALRLPDFDQHAAPEGPRRFIKQACQKAGIELELKSITASVFFSSDTANPDTYPHFYADLEEYANNATQPDPTTWLLQYVSWEVAQKANKWQGRNIVRWQSAEFDDINKKAATELDPVKRAAMIIRMNDLAVADNVLPLIYRGNALRPRQGHACPPQRLGQRPLGHRRLVEGNLSTAGARAMGAYLLRRLMVAIPSLLGISLNPVHHPGAGARRPPSATWRRTLTSRPRSGSPCG